MQYKPIAPDHPYISDYTSETEEEFIVTDFSCYYQPVDADYPLYHLKVNRGNADGRIYFYVSTKEDSGQWWTDMNGIGGIPIELAVTLAGMIQRFAINTHTQMENQKIDPATLPTVIAHTHNDPHTECPICGCERVDEDTTVSTSEATRDEDKRESTVEYVKRCITCGDLYRLVETTPFE